MKRLFTLFITLFILTFNVGYMQIVEHNGRYYEQDVRTGYVYYQTMYGTNRVKVTNTYTRPLLRTNEEKTQALEAWANYILKKYGY
jgi:ABC-type antimicrobial peptide transport system permease subunit